MMLLCVMFGLLLSCVWFAVCVSFRVCVVVVVCLFRCV